MANQTGSRVRLRLSDGRVVTRRPATRVKPTYAIRSHNYELPYRRTGAEPDLVIHVRGRDDANLLVVEFMVSANTADDRIMKDKEVIHTVVS